MRMQLIRKNFVSTAEFCLLEVFVEDVGNARSGKCLVSAVVKQGALLTAVFKQAVFGYVPFKKTAGFSYEWRLISDFWC
jgi:hypothetical protein